MRATSAQHACDGRVDDLLREPTGRVFIGGFQEAGNGPMSETRHRAFELLGQERPSWRRERRPSEQCFKGVSATLVAQVGKARKLAQVSA
jgi:hypothetical protein